MPGPLWAGLLNVPAATRDDQDNHYGGDLMDSRILVVVGGVLFSCLLFAIQPGVARSQPYDHLQCYKVKDTQKFSDAFVRLTPVQAQFEIPGNCELQGRAKKFCVPAQKEIVDPGTSVAPPVLPPTGEAAGDYICYKMKCPKEELPDQDVTDQFGFRPLGKLKKASLLCVPAVKGAVPTTTTTSTTSTSTTLDRCAGINCTASDQCHDTGVCDPATGLCSDPTASDGTPCSDGDSCTGFDDCQAGVCAGAGYFCSDGDSCTDDVCDGTGGCTYPINAGNCLIASACWVESAENPDNPCQSCDSSVSQTDWSALIEGSACDDGDVCTMSDQCQAGTCIGSGYVCDDGRSCTDDVCDGTGGCTYPIAAGTCLIDNTCWTTGQTNPGEPCQWCEPGTSQSAWSPGAPCG